MTEHVPVTYDDCARIEFTALVDTATWGAELATALAGTGERGHLYVVEPSSVRSTIGNGIHQSC